MTVTPGTDAGVKYDWIVSVAPLAMVAVTVCCAADVDMVESSR
jgi:hypothetical protein